MAQSARVGDLWMGIDCCHPPIPCVQMVGFIITGSPNSKSGGASQARLTDTVIAADGHTGIIVTASQNVKSNGLGKARIGDQIMGCNIGVIITGNVSHNIN